MPEPTNLPPHMRRLAAILIEELQRVYYPDDGARPIPERPRRDK